MASQTMTVQCAILSQITGRRLFKCLLRNLVPAICFLMTALSLASLWSFILASIAALAALIEPSRLKRGFSLLDFGLVLFYVSSCVSTALAYDISIALPQLQLRTSCLLLYLVLRSSGTSMPRLIAASGLGIIVHCIEALIAFSLSYREWCRLHFSTLVDFRSFVTLTLHGEKPGNYAAVFIIALTLAIYGVREYAHESCVSRIICIATLGLSLVCILLSFSRALYASSVFCILASIWGIAKSSPVKLRPMIVGLVVVLAIFPIALLCIRPVVDAVKDTMLIGTHLSQARSTNGRLSINKTALHLIPHVGLFGVGVSNYALEIRRQGLLSPSSLTAHAFNTSLEVSVEQGIFGLVALLVGLSGVTIILLRRFQSGRGHVLLGGCAALLLFSFSQSFIVADQATAALLAVLCALIAQEGDQYA